MALSLNGWAAIPSSSDSRLGYWLVPGTTKKILVRKEIGPVFAAFLGLVNQHVIPLNPGPLDSYEYRQAQAANGFSNHASGTATDMRYDVWTAEHKQFATADQIRSMHSLMNTFTTTGGKRIFGWGGDWGAGYTDDMHVEIAQYWEPGVGSFVSAADVQNVQKKLKIDSLGNIKKSVTVPGGTHKVHAIPPFPGTFGDGASGPYVKAIQLGLIGRGYKLVADGSWGSQTRAAVAAYEGMRLTRHTVVQIDARLYKKLARAV